jgi:tetratricopeptide (TPR) repeat protein
VRHLLADETTGFRTVLVACVVGQEGFSMEEVAQVTQQDLRYTLRDLDRLVSMGVLVAHRRRHSWRYAFVRQRVCKRLREELSPVEVAEAQRRWATALAETVRTEAHPVLEDIFRLAEWCDDRIDWSPVALALEKAATLALHMYGYPLAFQIYRKLLAKTPAERRSELTVWAAEAGNRAGQYEDVLPLLDTALRTASGDERPKLQSLLARTLYNKGEFARAMAVWVQTLDSLGIAVPGPTLGGALKAQTAFLRAVVGWVDKGLVTPPERIQPRLEACYGLIHANYFINDPQSVNALVSIVATVIHIAKATQRPDLLARAHFLFAYFYMLLRRPNWGRIEDHLQQSYQAAAEHGQPEVSIPTLRDIGYGMTQAGNPRQGLDWTTEGLRLAREVNDVNGQAWQLQVGGYIRRWTGDLETAARDLGEATILVESLQHGRLGVATRQELAHVLTWRGEFAEAETLFNLRRPFEVSTPFDDIQRDAYLGFLRYRQGRYDDALELLQQAFFRLQQQRNGTLWEMQVMHAWGLALADQARSAGWTPDKRHILARLVRRNARRSSVPPLMQVQALLLAAEEAEHKGHAQQAQAHFDTAIALCRTHDFKTDLAWALQRQALFMRRQGAKFQAVWEDAAQAWVACGAAAQATRWRQAASEPGTAAV